MERRKKHNTKYSPEFKISVIMDMRENHLERNSPEIQTWE